MMLFIEREIENEEKKTTGKKMEDDIVSMVTDNALHEWKKDMTRWREKKYVEGEIPFSEQTVKAFPFNIIHNQA